MSRTKFVTSFSTKFAIINGSYLGQSGLNGNFLDVTTNFNRIILFINFYIIIFSIILFILGTDKSDNLTCEIIYDNFTCKNYRFSNNHQS